MPRYTTEFAEGLWYKERTHWDETSDHLMVRNARYGWLKRHMAKVSRRNGRVAIEEQVAEDYTLYDLMCLWLAYIAWVEQEAFRNDLYGLLGVDWPADTKGCHCATCVQLRHHPLGGR